MRANVVSWIGLCCAALLLALPSGAAANTIAPPTATDDPTVVPTDPAPAPTDAPDAIDDALPAEPAPEPVPEPAAPTPPEPVADDCGSSVATVDEALAEIGVASGGLGGCGASEAIDLSEIPAATIEEDPWIDEVIVVTGSTEPVRGGPTEAVSTVPVEIAAPPTAPAQTRAGAPAPPATASLPSSAQRTGGTTMSSSAPVRSAASGQPSAVPTSLEPIAARSARIDAVDPGQSSSALVVLGTVLTVLLFVALVELRQRAASRHDQIRAIVARAVHLR